jgi:c(7)-type cytochrome triheme protein
MKKIIPIFIVAALTSLSLAGASNAADNSVHGGDITYTKPVKSVRFSHKRHVEEKELSCDLCHARFFATEALKVQENSDFTMEGLAQGKYCGVCHNGTMAFSVNSRCASCHAGVKGSGTSPGTAQSR